ncbi:unnamed protein product [Alopecurus aequalis]
MASSAVLVLILMAVAVTVRGHSQIAKATPAARFWEAALPGSPMPESIANLIRKGIDHSPLKEHHTGTKYLPNGILGSYNDYTSQCGDSNQAGAYAAVEGLFFHKADMRVGSAMTVAVLASDPAAFLPRAAADKIPFGNLADALARFSIAPGSDEATLMGRTVCHCHAAPLSGEQKACATSLEGVVQSATRMLATSRPVAAWASALHSSGLPRGKYMVQAIRPLSGGRLVACHVNVYPYAVYGCHMAEASSQAYIVSIRGGARQPTVDMAALCHFDTSNWSPAHPAFKVLGTHPGGSPVCHFLPYADLVFGEKADNNA